ncbi:sulfurtransferase [Rhizobium puerariae]|uniref:Sulfurtransferase n=1 Tax=Rhizobium puerariae TaxID=1585791 RepID=A0ABV6ADM0_9HYPH
MSLPLLVSADRLKARLDAAGPAIVVLDGTWFLSAANRDAEAEFLAGHIPGAQRFDIDKVADPIAPLAHALPDAATFAAAANGLGIGPETPVVVYDALGMFSAARVWWMFRAFGHTSVSLLDGGLPAWIAAGHPLETGDAVARAAARYPARDVRGIVTKEAILADLDCGDAPLLVDMRGTVAFAGTPEDRSGRVPGSTNLPFTELLDAQSRFLPPRTLSTRFAEAGATLDAPLRFSCGSGVTACIGAFAAALARVGEAGSVDALPSDALPELVDTIYPGSFAEWGRNPALPVERGAPARKTEGLAATNNGERRG